MRPSVNLANEAQHVGIHEVSLEHAEEKSAVDCPDLVCKWHITIIHVIFPWIWLPSPSKKYMYLGGDPMLRGHNNIVSWILEYSYMTLCSLVQGHHYMVFQGSKLLRHLESTLLALLESIIDIG